MNLMRSALHDLRMGALEEALPARVLAIGTYRAPALPAITGAASPLPGSGTVVIIVEKEH